MTHSNQQSNSSDRLDKALDNLIDWVLGHDGEELANIDFRKVKREIHILVDEAIGPEETAGRSFGPGMPSFQRDELRREIRSRLGLTKEVNS